MIKKLIIIIVGLIIFLVVVFGLINRLFPGKTLPLLSSEKSPLKNLACAYPVKVASSSMEPNIKEGSVLNFNKCFDQKREKLTPETLVLYQKFDKLVIGRIRPRTEEPKMLYYNVSQDARPQEVEHVFPKDILAIYEE